MAIGTRIFTLILTISLLTAMSAFAQEALWIELNDKAKSSYNKRKYDDAIKTAKEALEVAIKTFGKADEKVTISLSNLAQLYYLKKDYHEAVPL